MQYLFTSRLTQAQVDQFLRENGVNYQTCMWETQVIPRATLLMEEGKREQHYANDNYAFSGIPSITKLDWQVYLRKIFGDAYARMMNVEDIPNRFMQELTDDDINAIFSYAIKRNETIERKWEVEALAKGTRRWNLMH